MGLRPAAAAAPFRFKAVTLGRFMLYGPGGAFLASDGRAITLTRSPGPPADFTLERAGDAFTLTPTGSAMRVTAGSAGLRLGTDDGRRVHAVAGDGLRRVPRGGGQRVGPGPHRLDAATARRAASSTRTCT